MIDTLILAVVVGVLVACVHLSQPYKYIMRVTWLKGLKPFDCAECLGLWLFIIVAVYLDLHLVQYLFAGISSYVAFLVNQRKQKF